MQSLTVTVPVLAWDGLTCEVELRWPKAEVLRREEIMKEWQVCWVCWISPQGNTCFKIRKKQCFWITSFHQHRFILTRIYRNNRKLRKNVNIASKVQNSEVIRGNSCYSWKILILLIENIGKDSELSQWFELKTTSIDEEYCFLFIVHICNQDCFGEFIYFVSSLNEVCFYNELTERLSSS